MIGVLRVVLKISLKLAELLSKTTVHEIMKLIEPDLITQLFIATIS